MVNHCYLSNIGSSLLLCTQLRTLSDIKNQETEGGTTNVHVANNFQHPPMGEYDSYNIATNTNRGK